jgi:hypothetical protein
VRFITVRCDLDERGNAPSGTHPGKAVREVAGTYDRLIVISNEQATDSIPAPTGRGYVINVASCRTALATVRWVHIDGSSEAVIEYIHAMESVEWIN